MAPKPTRGPVKLGDFLDGPPKVDRSKSMDIFGSKTLERPEALDDFMWSDREQQHAARRVAILKAHPEIKKLFGNDPITAVYALCFVLVQFVCAYLLRNMAFTWQFWLVAYVVGATCNHALFLAIHEISHNLTFKGISANRMYSMFANLPVGLPYAISFKTYHTEHHKLQGVDGVDTDLPTAIEGVIFQNVLTKALFCTTQILFYSLRPIFVRYQKPTYYLLLNWAVQMTFDVLVVSIWGTGPLYYFLISSFLAGSLHPMGGHFIAEHYVFAYGSETFSYYGILNKIAFNVGYHNEHHDFPNVPWTRLPMVKKIAPEFYDTLPYHTSWVAVTWNFIFDPNVSTYNRVKRVATEKDFASLRLAD
jgi:sphingolipid delta-4 desaturase